MACTKQTYTAVAPWTASELADVFRDAFIDAGLMTDWHDSFDSFGTENRVLRVQYDATKTYGTTFYWYQFTTSVSGVYLHVATAWNTATHLPTGTQYLDYYSTSTNTSNHWNFGGTSVTSTTTLILERYTSGMDTKQSWFLMRWTTNRFLFTIAHPQSTLQSWLNLDRGLFVGFARAIPFTTGTRGFVDFYRGPALRSDLLIGSGLRGSTSFAAYATTAASQRLIGYGAVGHTNNSTDNYNFNTQHIILPIGFSATNPAYPADSNPVFHSLPYTPYLVDPLPSDFGISFHYATNTFAPGETFVVTAGVEEWEVLHFASNTNAITGASPLFLARMI